jgi:hypothetical protein
MVPNWFLIVALVLNVAVSLYLKPWVQVTNWVGAVRGRRMINAYRVAGLLLILVTVGRAQVHENPVPKLSAFCTASEFHALVCLEPRMYIDNEGTNWQYDGEIIWMNHKKYAVINGPAAKTGNEIVQTAGYSDGDAVIAESFQQRAAAKPDKLEQYVFNNWYWIALGVVVIFLVLQFGRGGEANETNIYDQLDPEYRTGFVTDYHGDDAFEVPDGMHSEHQTVPVRGRAARAGR